MASASFQISSLLLAAVGFLILLVATGSNSWKTSSSSWIYEGLWMNCAATALGMVQCKKFSFFLSLDKIAGFLFCVSGWMMVGIVLSNSYWKVSSTHGSVITSSSIYENLWHSCAEDSTGVSNCREFGTLLALPAYIQACRALMVTSLVLGLFGVLVTVFGLECTQLGNSNKNTKAKIATIGGMVFILSGLSSMVAISWYASMITAQFFDLLYAGTKYELGYALYVGWAGSLLSMLGGILLTCSCKGSKNQKHRNDNYDLATSQKANEPFIYNKVSETITSAKDYV